MRVAVVGYLSLDTIVTPQGQWRDVPGGAALYAALAAASAGAKPSLIAQAGADFPQDALDRAAAAGVDVSLVARATQPTRRSELSYLATGARIPTKSDPESWWRETMALLPPSLPQDAFAVVVVCAQPAESAALAIGRAGNARIVMDTSEFYAQRETAQLRTLFARASVAAPSREETRLLFPNMDDNSAAAALAALGPTVVQKRSTDGVHVVPARGGQGRTIPAKLETAVDPTGAGDSLVGGLAGALACGQSLDDAVAFGMRCARRAVGAVGAKKLGL
jgi:sugar/nucleoside kinase (ribokinase family)